jgi:DNA-directed RNA polymerase specialized sigma24 family protein
VAALDARDEVFASGAFATTQWSLITRATTPSPEGDAALEALCRAYWFPVYAFARKQGCSASDAEDVTQEFFAEIVQGEFLRRADAERGRFRSYLFTAVKRRIINTHERATAQSVEAARASCRLTSHSRSSVSARSMIRGSTRVRRTSGVGR